MNFPIFERDGIKIEVIGELRGTKFVQANGKSLKITVTNETRINNVETEIEAVSAEITPADFIAIRNAINPYLQSVVNYR